MHIVNAGETGLAQVYVYSDWEEGASTAKLLKALLKRVKREYPDALFIDNISYSNSADGHGYTATVQTS